MRCGEECRQEIPDRVRSAGLDLLAGTDRTRPDRTPRAEPSRAELRNDSHNHTTGNKRRSGTLHEVKEEVRRARTSQPAGDQAGDKA